MSGQHKTCTDCGKERDNRYFPQEFTRGPNPMKRYQDVCYKCLGDFWNPVITMRWAA